MLVLSRRIGQRINIGDDIVVQVTGCRGGIVSIGIIAPDNVQVHRHEIYRKIQDGQTDSLRRPTPAVDARGHEHNRPTTGSTGGATGPLGAILKHHQRTTDPSGSEHRGAGPDAGSDPRRADEAGQPGPDL